MEMCSHFVIHFKVRVKKADNVDLLSEPRSLEEVYRHGVPYTLLSDQIIQAITGERAKITGHPVAIFPLERLQTTLYTRMPIYHTW